MRLPGSLAENNVSLDLSFQSSVCSLCSASYLLFKMGLYLLLLHTCLLQGYLAVIDGDEACPSGIVRPN